MVLENGSGGKSEPTATPEISGPVLAEREWSRL